MASILYIEPDLQYIGYLIITLDIRTENIAELLEGSAFLRIQVNLAIIKIGANTMGVEANTYVLYGAKLPFDQYGSEEWYEKFEPYLDSAFKEVDATLPLNVVFDGMNGLYVFVGKVLARTDFYGDVDPTEITLPNKRNITKTIKKVLDIPISSKECKLWVFTHYR